MAATNYPTPSPELIEGELSIEIYPRGYTQWRGSLAQLAAEGLIPDGFELPHGKQFKHWRTDIWTFSLCRTRPAGLKGPMRLWVNGDYWTLRRVLKADEGSGFANARLHEKKMDLEREIWLQSDAWRVMSNRIWRAFEDQRYYAFRKRVLGRSA